MKRGFIDDTTHQIRGSTPKVLVMPRPCRQGTFRGYRGQGAPDSAARVAWATTSRWLFGRPPVKDTSGATSVCQDFWCRAPYIAGNQLSQERLVKEKDSLPCLRDSSVMIGSWIPVHFSSAAKTKCPCNSLWNVAKLFPASEASPGGFQASISNRISSQDLPISYSTPISSHQDSLGLSLSDCIDLALQLVVG